MTFEDRRNSLPFTVQHNLNHMTVGPLIGVGQFRHVFHCNMNPDWVFKIELDSNGEFPNAHEWKLWQDIKDRPEVARWFAPCLYISMDGNVLLQKRTEPIKRLPSKIPDFLTDIKLDNFGMYRGKIVCHDYGRTNIANKAFKNFKMVETKCMSKR